MLTQWNPWQDLVNMQREMTDVFRRSFGAWPFADGLRAGDLAWSPPIEVFSRDGDLVVRAELPGIDPEKDVDISVEGGALSISGERRQESRENGDGYYRSEATYGAFRRRVPLPEGVKPEDVTASYDNGILEVVVPKAAELSAPQRFPVAVGAKQRALDAEGEKK